MILVLSDDKKSVSFETDHFSLYAIAQMKQKTMPNVMCGDVNDDKAVDATDALWVLQHSVELRMLTETEQKAADVTDIGKVDTKDVSPTSWKTVELIDRFDVEKE